MRQNYLILFLAVLLTTSASQLIAQTDSLIAAYNTTALPEDKGKLAVAIALQYDRANPSLFLAWARKGFADVNGQQVAVRSTLARLIAETYTDNGAYDSSAWYLNVSLDNARAIKSVAPSCLLSSSSLPSELVEYMYISVKKSLSMPLSTCRHSMPFILGIFTSMKI